MHVIFHRTFRKHYKRLPNKIQVQFDKRLLLLLSDVQHPVLNVHPLRGDAWPFLSMNVTGDYRALFTLEKEIATFYDIGTHSELYE